MVCVWIVCFTWIKCNCSMDIFSFWMRVNAWNENWNKIKKCLNSKCFHFICFLLWLLLLFFNFFFCRLTIDSEQPKIMRWVPKCGKYTKTILSFCLYPMRAFPVRMKFQRKYLMSLLIWLFEYHLQYNHFCACTETFSCRTGVHRTAYTHSPLILPVSQHITIRIYPVCECISALVCMHVYVINYEIR